MRKIPLFFCLLLLLGQACQPSTEEKLTIATSANMQFAMEALIRTFSQETGIACATIISSSGKLTAQIKEGAPFDLLVSANLKYPRELFESGLATAAPEVYAYGKLVLWTALENRVLALDKLSDSSIRHIALANPKTAPYGMAAQEVLEHYNYVAALKEKLVYGESIAQTNQFILSKAADMGFTAKSVVLSPSILGKGQWMEVDSELYTPIEQGVVLLKNRGGQKEEAAAFYKFLFSDRGREILTNFGYQPAP